MDTDSYYIRGQLSPPVQTVTLITTAAFTVLGSVVNAFIVAVNGTEWVKSRRLNSIDIILTSLGAARFCFQWEIMLEKIIFAVYPDFTTQTESANTLFFTWVFLELSSFWFACWLSVFYCAKIANFSHPLFIFLKLKIPGIVPWLLLGSILVSLVISFPTAWGFCRIYPHNYTTDFSPNSSILTNCTLTWDLCKKHPNNSIKVLSPNITAGGLKLVHKNYAFLKPTIGLGYSLPFFIFCVAALLLIGSLWKHTRQMKGNTMAFTNPSLEAHFIAIKIMTSYFFFCTFYFICAIMDMMDWVSDESPWTLVISIGIAAYPSLHSVILILSNAKLKQSWARIFHHGKCPSGGETSENHESGF
ncbi:taste receptor type 2 member 7-like [Rhinatrema bivittatum]|uniref:taste receptor type 2 member 7-like n=1 Tax=Rhinatrema bivittatum TaxID=194408 RepID=UPI00112D2BC5|nr:taste receptor type 2 member 7-like [Rhinatrema bivittatum]